MSAQIIAFPSRVKNSKERELAALLESLLKSAKPASPQQPEIVEVRQLLGRINRKLDKLLRQKDKDEKFAQ